MFRPIVRALTAMGGYRCRMISFAEFRGMRSPPADLGAAGICRLLPMRVRPSSSIGPRSRRAWARLARIHGRELAWRILLGPRLRAQLAGADLVVVPNDAAYPYDRICAFLRARGTPFILVQEGIRYPRPGSSDPGHGKGGALAIAAWGASSAEFFRRQGLPEECIHLTGNPRFDGIRRADWEEEAHRLASHLELGEVNLLFLSNPIEQHGLCTQNQKLDLIGRFLHELAPFLADPLFRVILRPHAAESKKEFERLVRRHPFASRIRVVREGALYAWFLLARAAVVFATSAGLEALLFGLTLGVLEIPGRGFAHDYVQRGGAYGLSWGRPMAEQVGAMLIPTAEYRRAAERYIDQALAIRDGAGLRIARLIDLALQQSTRSAVREPLRSSGWRYTR